MNRDALPIAKLPFKVEHLKELIDFILKEQFQEK